MIIILGGCSQVLFHMCLQFAIQYITDIFHLNDYQGIVVEVIVIAMVNIVVIIINNLRNDTGQQAEK